MKQIIELKVNGDSFQIIVEPRRTLLEALREDIRLTGTKRGCDTSDCGLCTVIVDGKPVLSCLVLAVDAQGKDILTVEGLARDGQLHPLQKAFIDHGAIECGFCTPGMLLTGKALLDENPCPSEQEVRQAIAGNFCRCTGYAKIVEAILAASKKLKPIE